MQHQTVNRVNMKCEKSNNQKTRDIICTLIPLLKQLTSIITSFWTRNTYNTSIKTDIDLGAHQSNTGINDIM